MRRIGLLAAMIALVPMAVRAQNDVLVADDASNLTLRIVRDDPHPDLVKFLATNAKAIQLTSEGYPTLARETGLTVGRKLCGFPTDDYWRAFETRNGMAPNSFDPAKDLGNAGAGYWWPACFNFERGDFTHTLQPGELASTVYLAETGSKGTEETHKYFFRKSGVVDLNKVGAGQVLRYSFRTRPFVIGVEGDRIDFVNRLNALAKALHDQAANALAKPAVSPSIADGQVILAGPEPKAGAVPPGTPPDCAGISSPAEVHRIAEAYRTATNVRAPLVRIVVADNGFFGAARPGASIDFRALFDSKFFDIELDKDTGQPVVGPVLALDAATPISPLSLDNGFDAAYAPTAETGHGTHVAGLALGGDLRKDARFFGPAEGYWLRASLVAFSRGTREIPTSSAFQFREALRRATTYGKPDIVNMSLRFGPAARSAITEMVEDNAKVLFVVAAGNQQADLDSQLEVYPAALGDHTNVLAVAAETSPGVLADFTNRSAAVVDLAAPGCNLVSTLNGQDTTPLSGTSQAAALTTFSAALLRRLSVPTTDIKRRLVLSGDLISGIATPAPGGGFQISPVPQGGPGIRTRSRLNIAKALYKDFDYLSYREAGVAYQVLGKLGPRTGPGCGKPTWTFDKVRAFKRVNKAGQAFCFWRNHLEPTAIATAAGHKIRYFEVQHVIAADGTITPQSKYLLDLKLDDVDEFVLSETNMNLNP